MQLGLQGQRQDRQLAARGQRATRSGMADNSGVRCNSDTMVRMAPDSTATCGKPAPRADGAGHQAVKRGVARRQHPAVAVQLGAAQPAAGRQRMRGAADRRGGLFVQDLALQVGVRALHHQPPDDAIQLTRAQGGQQLLLQPFAQFDPQIRMRGLQALHGQGRQQMGHHRKHAHAHLARRAAGRRRQLGVGRVQLVEQQPRGRSSSGPAASASRHGASARTASARPVPRPRPAACSAPAGSGAWPRPRGACSGCGPARPATPDGGCADASATAARWESATWSVLRHPVID